jgi:acyl transferase domain-containing protein
MIYPQITFCFCGQGGQHETMGVDLYHSSSIFRCFLERLDHFYTKLSQVSMIELSNIKTKQISNDVIENSSLSLILSSFIQLGIVYLLQKANIYCKYTIGHSNGEFLAFFSTLDLEDLYILNSIVFILYNRSFAVNSVPEGMMMVAKTSEKVMTECIAESEYKCWISAINTDTSVTVSGLCNDIDSLYTHCKEQTHRVSKLPSINKPFHSPYMIECATCFNEKILPIYDSLKPIRSYIHCSSVDGESYTSFSSSYWFKNITQPVQFLKACQCLQNYQSNIVIEISPTPVLHNFLKTNIPNVYVCCIQDDSGDTLDASFVSVIVDMAKAFDDLKKQVNWSFLLNEFQSEKCQELFTSLNKN